MINDSFRSVALAENVALHLTDSLEWLCQREDDSLHAVVTDPPYGANEFESKDHDKLRSGRGGVWRIPPSFDGAKRLPVPRFTTMTDDDLARMQVFFAGLARELHRVLVPGAHVFLASNPLVSSMTFETFRAAGFEKRGEVIRLLQTLRGGDRPKGHESRFSDLTVMPRSGWEPWGLFRKPLDGTVAQNLDKWGTGALRRVSAEQPFRDVIPCGPTRAKERGLCPHPSLKPQRFMRQIVRACLPMDTGTLYDPFAGGGSTLAASKAMGYAAIGTERDPTYFQMAVQSFDGLSNLL